MSSFRKKEYIKKLRVRLEAKSSHELNSSFRKREVIQKQRVHSRGKNSLKE
jgi:hypothetical protein